MTDDQRRVRTDSDALLDAMRSLRDAEQRKRRAPFSSKEFQALAEEVEQQAVDVWKLAARERDDGERVESSLDSPESVEPLGGKAETVDGKKVAVDGEGAVGESTSDPAPAPAPPTPLGEE